ncbi:MAG: tetratricopeptide repeat protein [Coprobacter sp.]
MNTAEAEKLIKNAERAAQMLRRVEEVQIIDSLIVDKASFFKHYKLSSESGTLHDYNTFFNLSSKNNSTVYQNQRGDKILYGAKTAKNGYDIMTRSKLIDDSWGEEIALPAPVNSSANENYPYLLSDGTTLYFASSGEESLGGYDIFVTRLNLNTGNYLVPENMGMPFNSIYNDYMLAIDELNNVGWFVSDRFQAEDKLIVYLFIPNTEKKIYKGGDESRARSLARIGAIKDSWIKGVDYKPILEKIARIGNPDEGNAQKGDFLFQVNNRITYVTLKDFDSNEARNLFIKAQDIRKLIRETEDKLQQLRSEYRIAQNKKPFESQIARLEQALLKLYGQPEELEAKSRAEEISYLIKLQNQKKK